MLDQQHIFSEHPYVCMALCMSLFGGGGGGRTEPRNNITKDVGEIEPIKPDGRN